MTMLPSELKLTSLGHCYVQLPNTFISRVPSLTTGAIIYIRSIQNDNEVWVMWNGQLTSGEHAELDLSFGQANNFQDEFIVLSLVEYPELADCSLCRVELVETSDYSIISQHLDANVLDTCKLVSKGLVIPIWLSQHVKVLVKVVEVQPDKNLVQLTKWTEMQFHHSLDNLPQPETVEDKETSISNPLPFVSCSLGIGYKPKFHLGSILVCGERGAGKTHFLETVINNYKGINSELFNCKQLRGKRPETIKKRMNELLTNALDKQPSIIGLDDIDSFVSSDLKHEDELGQEAIYKKRLVDILCHMLKQLERSEHSRGQNVIIIATCRSMESLDERIFKPKGRQYFNEVMRIGNINVQNRVEIIKNIIAGHKQIHLAIDDNQMENVAKKCDSYMPLDLRRIVERSIINACSRSLLDFNSDPVTIQVEDLTSSIVDYVPSNLRGVALQPKTMRTFDNVGGMKKIKEALMKTILLQIKYPKLFKRCPMKSQTSILLYGPPGCGKTLLAEALTNQDCINSICVRGPELLSKYIGASEAAVRDLFKRAELAKPCVIFFDEFESLVSRRGADRTGVTDRIVNQFLTLMDGVENLSSNIFIVAATSRPDMIDPAILRPGRLDKHIYCPIPDQEDRLDIIRVLGKDIEIENFDSCLVEWSHRLEGFTGADIQSFLYSAQLKALHAIVGPSYFISGKSPSTNNKEKENNVFEIIVKQIHMEESFNEMKPNVDANHAYLLKQYPATIRRASEQVSVRATLA